MGLKQRIAVGALSLSAAGLLGIASHEGFSDTAYIPIADDVPTIGFGSTEGVKMGDKITVPQALERLHRDVNNAESAIGRCVTVPLSQGEYDAYTSLAFNIGASAFCSSTLVRKLNGGDYEGACAEILRWDKKKIQTAAGKTVTVTIKGLSNRRKKEYEMCVKHLKLEHQADRNERR